MTRKVGGGSKSRRRVRLETSAATAVNKIAWILQTT